MREALVKYKDVNAGILKETDEGYEFSYLPEYLQSESAKPVSLTYRIPTTIHVYAVQ